MAYTDKITWIAGMFGPFGDNVEVGHVEQIYSRAKVVGSDEDPNHIGYNWIFLTESLLSVVLILQGSIPSNGINTPVGVLPEKFRNKLHYNITMTMWGYMPTLRVQQKMVLHII